MNNIIAINRGDSFAFDLTIEDDNTEENYILKNDDTVYFSVMFPHQPFEEAIITKTYTKSDCGSTGEILVSLSSSDTINLTPGIYYYTIKLFKKDNAHPDIDTQVLTVINRTKFVIYE